MAQTNEYAGRLAVIAGGIGTYPLPSNLLISSQRLDEHICASPNLAQTIARDEAI